MKKKKDIGVVAPIRFVQKWIVKKKRSSFGIYLLFVALHNAHCTGYYYRFRFIFSFNFNFVHFMLNYKFVRRAGQYWYIYIYICGKFIS